MTGQQFKVAHEGALLQYLFEILPGQSRTGVKNLLSKGQVLVNGESRTAFDHPLQAGDKLTILPKGISIARSVREDAKDTVLKAGVKILFEDENYLVVDKPSGMLTVATGKEKNTLYSLLNAYVKVNARMQRKEDLISGDVTPLCQYEFSKTSQRQATLDVTEQLNAALAVGEGALTFRLRNITIETLGNRFSSAEGVSVPRQSVKLYIIPRRD